MHAFCRAGKMTEFLAFDSGPGPERIVVFATGGARRLAIEHTEWFCDGTFKTAPKLFYQLYTIHVNVEGVVVPLFYCLLSKKTEAMYDRLFQIVDDLGRALVVLGKVRDERTLTRMTSLRFLSDNGRVD